MELVKNMDTLDNDVVNIAKAIRQTESGGNFKAKGKSGEFGGYQFTPDTWNAVAPKYGITSKLEDATPEEQNEVVYNRIKGWKDSGKNIGQVASMWNAGEGEPDAYTGKFSDGRESVGTNKFGAKFDVPKYADSVSNAYHTIKGGGQAPQDFNNPSSVGNNPEALDASNTQSETEKHGLIKSTVQSLASHFLRMASNVRAGIDTVNAKGTGEELKNNLNEINNKEYDYGYFGKAKPLKGETVGDVGDALLTGTKAGGEIGSIIGTAGAVKGLITGGTRALTSSPIENIMMKGFRMAPGEFKTLSSAEKLNALTEALKSGVSPSNRIVLEKAIQEVTPKAARELGIAPGLIKSGLKKLARGGWKALTGGSAATYFGINEIKDILQGKDGE